MDRISFEEFKRLDIRVAIIKKVDIHPNGDKLYVLTIDVGDREKVIVAGIRPFYNESELLNKKIVIIDNLEPASIRGITSDGMLLATKDGDRLALIVPDKDVQVGCRIS